MPSLVSKPLLAVSLALPSLLILGYLWQKRRSDEAELNREDICQDQVFIDSKEVSQKLETLQWSRLDCIEEEIVVGEDKTKKVIVDQPTPKAEEEQRKQVVEESSIVEIEQESSTVEIEEVSSIVESEMPVMESPQEVCAEVVPSSTLDPTSPIFSSKVENQPEHLSTSPVKSEGSDSQKSYESWSDLIEQDEREELVSSVVKDKLSGNTSDTMRDSGMVSPNEDEESETAKNEEGPEEVFEESDSVKGGSKSGDEGYSEDNQLLVYHFHVPDHLCGSFIGGNGAHIKKLKETCNCNITLKDNVNKSKRNRGNGRSRNDRSDSAGSLNLCIIEGTRSNIDKCLDMVRDKFHSNPELTLEQINRPDAGQQLSLNNVSVTLSMAEGIMHDVFVSSIVNGGHIFVQQPGHPTFSALERLEHCMYNTYTQLATPELVRPIQANSICVVNSGDAWYRAQVVSYDEIEDVCDIKYIDYGGYDSLAADQLRQIRTDFLSLPFQSIECYLANIVATEEDTVSASILEELIAGQVVQARMIGLSEEGTPMVHLYRAVAGQTVMVNRELVDRSCANWVEATIIPCVQ